MTPLTLEPTQLGYTFRLARDPKPAPLMDTNSLTPSEKATLLKLARQALELSVRGEKLPPLNLPSLTPLLRADGASFVTLTIRGRLRGCIGTLEPYQSLAEDVRERAIAAALKDPRFPAVQPEELKKIEIEISRLTLPAPLTYTDADDLLVKLRPHVDGVILKDGYRRATYLPQVWEQLPDADAFLNSLCEKMGNASNTWQRKNLEVLIYQVDEFHE